MERVAKRTIWTLTVAAVVALGLQVRPSHADLDCLPYDDAVKVLKDRYGVERLGAGLGAQGRTVTELYVNGEGRWMVLKTRTNRTACVIASGHDWAGPLPDAVFGDSL